MHETSIAQSIIKTVLEQARQQNAVQIKSVEIEIGELTFLSQEQVSFWIKIGFKNTIAKNAVVHFKEMKAVIQCKSCSYQGYLQVQEDPVYHLKLPQFNCPNCSNTDIEIIQGKETFIRSITITKA